MPGGTPAEEYVRPGRSPDDSDTLEIHDSRAFFAAYSAGMAMLAVPCALVSGWGPVLAVVFGSHALWSLRRLFDRRPRIRVTAEGIHDENFWYSPGLIRWDEIRDVRRTRFGLIELELRDEGAFWNRLSPLQQLPRVKMTLFGFGPATITPWGLQESTARVLGILQEGLEQHLLESVRREHDLLPPTGRATPATGDEIAEGPRTSSGQALSDRPSTEDT